LSIGVIPFVNARDSTGEYFTFLNACLVRLPPFGYAAARSVAPFSKDAEGR
jgi:hypothetical protein